MCCWQALFATANTILIGSLLYAGLNKSWLRLVVLLLSQVPTMIKPKQDVIDDSPKHIAKLLALRQQLTKSYLGYKMAKENAADAKKQLEHDRGEIENYLRDLDEETIFDEGGE